MKAAVSVIMTVLILLSGRPADAASVEDLPETLETTIDRLRSLKQAAETVVRTVKTDIQTGALPANEGPVVRLAYRRAANAADAVIDEIIGQVDDLPQVITPTTFEQKASALSQELAEFKTIVGVVYERNGEPGEGAPANAGAALALIGVLISGWHFFETKITEQRIKKYVNDQLDSTRWRAYGFIIPLPRA